MDEKAEANPTKSRGLGCGAVIAIALVLLALVMIGSNAAFGYYLKNCQDQDFFDCMLNKMEEPEPEGAVVATGVYSYKGYSVTVTANIPLEGGAVTGSVSGTCDGTLKGNFDGENNGVFSGKLAGACSPFFVNIPAGATFTGTVNKDSKVAPIDFSGSGAGFEHQDSMSLSY